MSICPCDHFLGLQPLDSQVRLNLLQKFRSNCTIDRVNLVQRSSVSVRLTDAMRQHDPMFRAESLNFKQHLLLRLCLAYLHKNPRCSAIRIEPDAAFTVEETSDVLPGNFIHGHTGIVRFAATLIVEIPRRTTPE